MVNHLEDCEFQQAFDLSRGFIFAFGAMCQLATRVGHNPGISLPKLECPLWSRVQ